MVVFEASLLIPALQALGRFFGLFLHVFGATSVDGDPVQAAIGLQEAVASVPSTPPAPLEFDTGAGQPKILIPRSERLTYRAYLDIAFVTQSVGTVTQTCRVEEQRGGVLTPVVQGEAATVQLYAKGKYFGYSLQSTIESRILPQDWPHILYLVTSEGSERRRREVMVGRVESVHTSSYRSDTNKNAPEGTRIWRDARQRQVPEGTLDMLSAVLMARTLVREEREKIVFPLIDKTRVWQLTLERGEERRMETGAGAFDVVEVILNAAPYPGEEIDQEKLDQFEGVFGIHGTIHLWVEKKTGVAVRIQGDLPVGPLTLGIDVVLDSYSGTPPGFVPTK
jgi:hypothetical protein